MGKKGKLECRDLNMSFKEPKYISLKDAAELSGYSADYVGQLIRNGKLPGKQVFLNVAWMTTKEAIEEYTKDKKSEKKPRTFSSLKDEWLSAEGLSLIYTYILWGVAVLLVLFILALCYVFAVSMDHSIEAQYLEKIEYGL